MADILVRDAATSIISEFGLSTPAIAVLALAGTWSSSSYLSWTIARTMYSQYGDELAAKNEVINTRMEHIGSAITLVLAQTALRAVSGVRDVADTVVREDR